MPRAEYGAEPEPEQAADAVAKRKQKPELAPFGRGFLLGGIAPKRSAVDTAAEDAEVFARLAAEKAEEPVCCDTNWFIV
eukprot:SAG11_NODE_830_length_6956_cov_11.233484_1_plen_79_part_00